MKKQRLFFSTVVSVLALLSTDAVAQPNNVNALKQRLALLEKRPDYRKDTAYINTLNRLAFVYASNYPDSAISLLADYVDKEGQAAYKRGEAEALKILGTAYQKKGDYAAAEKHYGKAYALAQKNGLDDLMPGILNNIGLNYLSQGNHSAALKNFFEALKQAEVRGDRFVAGRVYNNIANVHFYQGKMAEAEAAYNQTLRIAKETADTAGITLAYNNLGEVAIEIKDFPKALQNLTAAYNFALKANNKELQVASTKNLGALYLQTDSADKAIRYFDNAYQLALQLSNRPSAAKALIGLAKAKQKTGALKEALKDALAAVQLAQDMGQASLQRDANEVAASIYESIGNGTMALRHYKIFKQYADSLRSLESERMATRLQAEFDFSKKELEFQR
ncbi:MAG: tetratricopeptide repeat protein, partial [Chitinophagaceae bacterium]